jgi:hypothetical protein
MRATRDHAGNFSATSGSECGPTMFAVSAELAARQNNQQQPDALCHCIAIIE